MNALLDAGQGTSANGRDHGFEARIAHDSGLAIDRGTTFREVLLFLGTPVLRKPGRTADDIRRTMSAVVTPESGLEPLGGAEVTFGLTVPGAALRAESSGSSGTGEAVE